MCPTIIRTFTQGTNQSPIKQADANIPAYGYENTLDSTYVNTINTDGMGLELSLKDKNGTRTMYITIDPSSAEYLLKTKRGLAVNPDAIFGAAIQYNLDWREL
jgi:hypothetical protein